MNLRDLKYLVAVARHRHFGKAAEACFVSQPTLSTQLKKLEETLGVTLIERNSRHVLLTSVGETIVAQAEEILRRVDELSRTAEQHRDPFGGEFRLGVIPTVAPYLLPRILPPIRKALPKLELRLTEAQTAVITELLRSGDLDAMILALPVEDDGFTVAPLYAEPFYFAASRQHPKAKAQDVSLADLDHEQVLLLEDGHCLRDQALEICKTANAVENTNFRATSIETLRQMVAANIGVTLMPELAVRRNGAVRYLPFRGRGPHREIGLAWRATTSRGELMNRLACLLAAATKK